MAPQKFAGTTNIAQRRSCNSQTQERKRQKEVLKDNLYLESKLRSAPLVIQNKQDATLIKMNKPFKPKKINKT